MLKMRFDTITVHLQTRTGLLHVCSWKCFWIFWSIIIHVLMRLLNLKIKIDMAMGTRDLFNEVASVDGMGKKRREDYSLLIVESRYLGENENSWENTLYS